MYFSFTLQGPTKDASNEDTGRPFGDMGVLQRREGIPAADENT